MALIPRGIWGAPQSLNPAGVWETVGDKVARVGQVEPPLVEARTRGLLVEKLARVELSSTGGWGPGSPDTK